MDTTKVEAAIKRTIGYSESTNKREFMKGAKVAMSKMEDLLAPEIASLTTQLKNATANYKYTLSNIEAMARIIKQYTYE